MRGKRRIRVMKMLWRLGEEVGEVRSELPRWMMEVLDVDDRVEEEDHRRRGWNAH